ncbi:MAG: exosortase K [Eubacteriales bacterium]
MTAKAQIKPREKTFNITNFIFYAGAAAIGAALKIFYDIAGNDQLIFMIKTASNLVALFYNTDFFYDSKLGYVSHQLGITIGKSCAGINYMIIVLLMLAFSYIHYFKSTKSKIIYFAVIFPAAYLMTILANSSRIILSIKMLDMSWLYNSFSKETVHLITGIFTFVGFLILFNFLFSIIIKKVRKRNEEFT